VATELVLLGTAGAPLPVAGRGGISSAVVVDGRVFVVDCGRGCPSAFVSAGLDFTRLEAVFLTHLHVDHLGDLPGMILYPWGVRGSVPPLRVYGPSRPAELPEGDAVFHRVTTIDPELPAPGTADLVEHILAAFAYHLNVMPLDARMPDAGSLVRGFDLSVAPGPVPVMVFEDDAVRVTAVAVMHGRAVPALAYRFDTADGSVVFSGDTAASDNLIALAQGADILVHQVADLDYLRRHGTDEAELTRMAALHTDVSEVGGVAERARVRELILSHYLPADPGAVTDWAQRAGQGFSGTTTAGHDGLRRSVVHALWPFMAVYGRYGRVQCWLAPLLLQVWPGGLPAGYSRLTGAGNAIAVGTYRGSRWFNKLCEPLRGAAAVRQSAARGHRPAGRRRCDRHGAVSAVS
jgi:ribonuclease BN (tRNA processing enzyme)